MSKAKERILVPVDFSGPSDAALSYALALAGTSGADVELLHVWSPRGRGVFAETPQGAAMEERLSAAEAVHAARVSGRLEFGEEPSSVILGILERERFDLVVMGNKGVGAAEAPPRDGHVAKTVAGSARCRVVTLPADDTEAA